MSMRKRDHSLAQFAKKSFVSKCHLDTHFKRVHERDKPIRCQLCPVKFCFLSRLKLHIKTENIKDFKCPVCHKAFRRSNYVKQHFIKLVVHQKE